MRVADGIADLGEELEPEIEGKLVIIAVAVDGHAFDQLHREIGQPAGRESALDEPRDAGMLEQREDTPFFEESAQQPRRAMPDDLDGRPLLELAVGALAEEHDAHAPLTNRPHNAPGADTVGSSSHGEQVGGVEQRPGHGGHGRFEEALRAAMCLQQAQHLLAQLRIIARHAVEIGHLLVSGEIDQGVEHGLDAETIGRGRGHQIPRSGSTIGNARDGSPLGRGECGSVAGRMAGRRFQDAARVRVVQRRGGRGPGTTCLPDPRSCTDTW